MNRDELLTYKQAGELYGYKPGTMAAYVSMGYVIGIDGKIPRYELERYMLERRKRGPQPKIDWAKVRERVIEVAVALSGERPGWHYNKGAYVLAASRVLGHSPLWISKVLQVPLDEVKLICRRLHESGTWNGEFSMHTEWTDIASDGFLKRYENEGHHVHIGFALDCLVAQGQAKRHHVKERFCMSCGGHNPVRAWLCPGCAKPHIDVVALICEACDTKYSFAHIVVELRDLSNETWGYPIEGTTVTFGLPTWKPEKLRSPTKAQHFTEVRKNEYDHDYIAFIGHEKAAPPVVQEEFLTMIPSQKSVAA